MIIKCNIKWQSAKAGMTITKLSAKSGVSMSTIKNAMLNKNIALFNAIKIANALELTVNDVFEVTK